MKSLSTEARVGLLVLVSALLLGGFVFILGGFEVGKKYDVYVDFDNPGTLKPGAAVTVGGIHVGKVEEIRYMGGRLDQRSGRHPLVRTHLRIDDSIQDTIHDDAVFYVALQSVLGESMIVIEPGTPDSPALARGSIVEGVDQPRLDLALSMGFELLETMTRFFRENREELRTALSSAASLIRQLDEVFGEHHERIGRMLTNLDRAIEQTNTVLDGADRVVNGPRMERTLANVDRTLAAVARDIEPLLADARTLAHQGTEIAAAIGPDERRELQTTIHRAAELTESANATLADARAIVTHIRSGQGSVGAMVMNEEMYDDVQELVRDLKHNPWKFFWRE